MDWILTQLTALYIWLSQAPVFIQVALGVFIALITKSFIYLWLPSPYFAALQSIRNSFPVLAYGFDSLEERLKQVSEQLTEIEEHAEKLAAIEFILDDIRSDVSDIEKGQNGERDFIWFGESNTKEKGND